MQHNVGVTNLYTNNGENEEFILNFTGFFWTKYNTFFFIPFWFSNLLLSVINGGGWGGIHTVLKCLYCYYQIPFNGIK